MQLFSVGVHLATFVTKSGFYPGLILGRGGGGGGAQLSEQMDVP